MIDGVGFGSTPIVPPSLEAAVAILRHADRHAMSEEKLRASKRKIGCVRAYRSDSFEQPSDVGNVGWLSLREALNRSRTILPR